MTNQKHYLDLVSALSSACSRCHSTGSPLVAWPNVGCFLRLYNIHHHAISFQNFGKNGLLVSTSDITGFFLETLFWPFFVSTVQNAHSEKKTSQNFLRNFLAHITQIMSKFYRTKNFRCFVLKISVKVMDIKRKLKKVYVKYDFLKFSYFLKNYTLQQGC